MKQVLDQGNQNENAGNTSRYVQPLSEVARDQEQNGLIVPRAWLTTRPIQTSNVSRTTGKTDMSQTWDSSVKMASDRRFPQLNPIYSLHASTKNSLNGYFNEKHHVQQDLSFHAMLDSLWFRSQTGLALHLAAWLACAAQTLPSLVEEIVLCLVLHMNTMKCRTSSKQLSTKTA